MVGTPRCYFRGAGKVKIGGVVDSGVIPDDKVLVASFTARTNFVIPFDGNARLISVSTIGENYYCLKVHLKLTTSEFQTIFRDCRIESHRFYPAKVLVKKSFADGTILVDPNEWVGPKVFKTTIRSTRSGDLYVDLSKIPEATDLVLRGSRKLGEISDGRIRFAIKTQECFIATLNPPLIGELEHQIIGYFTTPFVRRWD